MSDLSTDAALFGTLVLVWMAAWVDIRTLQIPNALSVYGATIGVLAHVWGFGLDGLWQSLAGLGLGMALLLPGYLLRLTGAGDVKLMGAVGALLGVAGVFQACLLTLMAGGVVGAFYALAAWKFRGAAGPVKRYKEMFQFWWATGRFNYTLPAPDEALAQRFPFALSIALGSTAAILWPL